MTTDHLGQRQPIHRTKGDQARQLTTEAIQKLAQALEAGKSDTLTAFLTAVARFHHYSFGNVMLIAAQRPDATHVAGFNAWRKLGRYVKKGEKGIVIIAPVPLRRDTNTTAADDETRDTGMRFKAAYVFDVSQTDGEPLPQLTRVTGDPGDYATRVKNLINSRGIALDYAEDLDGADGQSAGGRITVRLGLPPAEEFSVLVHEFAHEMLHHTSEQRPPKTVRETEAEAVAFIVSEGVGLTTGTAAADYIQLYRGDVDTLTASLERIRETAVTILAALLPTNTQEVRIHADRSA